jgi:hypothetical protein
MSEDKGVIKPIFIGVATTVLTTVILYYLGFQKDSSPSKESESGSRPPQSNLTSPEVPQRFTPAVDAGFERRKQATLKVWHEMQNIDAASIGTPPSSATFQQMANFYGRIDLSEVDPVLITHINESIAIYQEAINLHLAYETEALQIQQAWMYDLQKQYVFQQLQVKYQPYFYNLGQKLEGINNRDKTLARMLTEKYDAVFVDRQ